MQKKMPKKLQQKKIVEKHCRERQYERLKMKKGQDFSEKHFSQKPLERGGVRI